MSKTSIDSLTNLSKKQVNFWLPYILSKISKNSWIVGIGLLPDDGRIVEDWGVKIGWDCVGDNCKMVKI
jgi:hypothetical protein